MRASLAPRGHTFTWLFSRATPFYFLEDTLAIRLPTGRFRRCTRVIALTGAIMLGLLSGPALAAPAVTATDHDLNWGAREAHFPQNKQAESPMAINPTNALNGITGAIDMVAEPDCMTDPSSGGSLCYPGQTTNSIGVYATTDGGATWNKEIVDFSGIGRLANADPTIAFGPKPNGSGGFSYAKGARAYLAAMAFPYGNVSPYAEPVVVTAISDDGGLTWTAPAIASGSTSGKSQFNDKPTIWVDSIPASPSFGNVYVVWARFSGVGSAGSTFFCSTCPVQILLARSTDGARTWGQSVPLSSAADSAPVGYQERPTIQTDREGRVIVAWEEYVGATKKTAAMVASVSADAGQHFGRPVVIGAAADLNQLPGASFPNFNQLSLAADPASDALYAAWTNYTPIDNLHGHGNVAVMTSLDHGQTWASAGTIDVPGRTAFHPALAVARPGSAPAARTTPGRVVVGFTALTDVPFGTAPVTGAVNYLPYVAASDDGGATWSAPLVPSGAALSDPAASAGFLNDFGSEFVGDYASLSAAPDGTTFTFSYSSTQEGTGCAAVDAYRTGTGPLPNIYTSCSSTFGNVDIHVAAIGGS